MHAVFLQKVQVYAIAFMSKSSACIQHTVHLTTTSSTVNSVQSELGKTFVELEELSHCQGPEHKLLSFWRDCQADFPILTPMTENPMVALA